MSEADLCTVCGLPIEVGQWPCVVTIRPHGKSVQTSVFVPYFDVALGRQVDSFADRWRGMKETGVQYRDKVSTGELSARRDRQHEAQKEAQRE